MADLTDRVPCKARPYGTLESRTFVVREGDNFLVLCPLERGEIVFPNSMKGRVGGDGDGEVDGALMDIVEELNGFRRILGLLLFSTVLEWHWDGMGWDVMAGGRDMVFTVVLG